jgi:restriction system protein
MLRWLGAEGIAKVIRTKMAVQVKKWSKQNVQTPQVQQVRGSLGAHEQGMIITTSDFSKGALAEAISPNKVPVALMNGEQLVALMVEHEVMVTRRSHDILELEDDETT